MVTTTAASDTKSFGFIAYPEGARIVEEAINGAVELAGSGAHPLKSWKAMSTIGYKVDDVVRRSIDDAAVLIADITYPNLNVFYEIGVAAGRTKPVIPIVNLGIERAVKRIQSTGLFDTIGWATYTNARELHEKLCDWPNYSWSSSYTRKKNHSQPLFILDTLIKTDFRNHIFHSVDNSHVRYRSFEPTEVPRLTAAQAIAEVSCSAGVIIPIIDLDIVDAELNNLRASFILGLCHGFSVEALTIQYGNGPPSAAGLPGIHNKLDV